jgi:8-oxo-dGTP pyrophosphatase MutT (NUDIX family)
VAQWGVDAPRPASTVLALRDGPGGVEVLMLRRNLNSDFVGGAYVFPGGSVDETDRESAWEGRVAGVDDAAASTRLGLAEGGLAYLVAALRELFEEAGLLLAAGAERVGDRLAEHRRALNEGRAAFAEVIEAEGLVLAAGELVYLAHWITPEGPPRRFDTRFFVARAPEGQRATHDAGETVADTWITPSAALAARRRGELDMILPTVRTLESIARFTRVEEVLAWARELGEIAAVRPRIVTRDGEVRILMPGDEGYEVDDG